MMARIYHVVRGRCNWCGRLVPGVPVVPGRREMEGECPRCGRSPFLLDDMGGWADNIAKMTDEQALALIPKLEDDREIETLFRVEFMGPNRDHILEALHKRYWQVVDVPPEATTRGRAMTLTELRAAWARELEHEDSRRMYEMLGQVRAA